MKTILLASVILCWAFLSHSFLFNQRITPVARTKSFTKLPSSAIRTILIDTDTNEDSVEIKSENKKWTMEQDWVLQDSVPKYTVLSNCHLSQERRWVTFWGQLKQGAPELKGRSDHEMEERYKELLEQTKGKDDNKSIQCGPAPPLVNDWWVQDDKNRMGGTITRYGRPIWFTVHSGGTLDNTLESNQSMNRSFVPGGFVKTFDGSIYELGVPIPPFKANKSRAELNVHVRKLILMGITISSILSASIAFEIGHQMTPYDTNLSKSQHTLNIAEQRQVKSAISSTSSSTRNEVSIEEQRAVQELKVLREKRYLTYLEDKIEVDEVKVLKDQIQEDEKKLSLLQREETRQEGAKLGFY